MRMIFSDLPGHLIICSIFESALDRPFPPVVACTLQEITSTTQSGS